MLELEVGPMMSVPVPLTTRVGFDCETRFPLIAREAPVPGKRIDVPNPSKERSVIDAPDVVEERIIPAPLDVVVSGVVIE